MERKEDCFLGGSLPHWRGCSIHSNPIPFLIIERRPVSSEGKRGAALVRPLSLIGHSGHVIGECLMGQEQEHRTGRSSIVSVSTMWQHRAAISAQLGKTTTEQLGDK